MLTFRREDGVAENFHTSQNRELLEKLSEQTGGRYYTPDEASKLANEISYSEAGITTRETRDLWDMPIIFLLAAGHARLRMAAAAQVGCGMKRAVSGRRSAAVAGLLTARWRAPRATTYYVTISGLGGEPDYDQRFKMWAEDIDSSLKKAGGDPNVITWSRPRATRSARASRSSPGQVKPADALVLMLIGHGTYDGVEYKFNIPGPDITGAELAALLDRVPATRQLVVNMTSSSGGSIALLRRPTAS